MNIFCSSFVQTTFNNFGLNIVGVISKSTRKQRKVMKLLKNIYVGTVRNKLP